MIKFVKIVLAAGLAITITGCERKPEEYKALQENNMRRNAQTLGTPAQIGTLFTGQTVYLATVAYSGPTSGDNQTHYIYFVPGASTESTNWRQPSGKTMVPKVNAVVELGPNPSADRVIEVAEKLKKEQEQADLDQLKALCQKYGCKE